MGRTRFVLTLLCALTASPAHAQSHEPVPSYVEVDGVVAIEAERYSARQGPWFLVEGRNAGATGYGIAREYRLHATGATFTAAGAGAVEFDRLFPIGWGHPTRDGVTALTLDADPSRAAVFAYEAGARMQGLVAPARRVALFSPHADMPEAAWGWVDGAIRWALEEQVAGRTAGLIVGSLTLSAHDEALVARLGALGLQVRTLIHTAGLTDDGPAPDVLLVSESVHPDRVGARFREVPLPVVVMKTFVYEHMGMVDTRPASWEGNAMMIAEGAWTDHLRYAIHFTRPGDYTLWLLGRDGGEGGANEVKVFFDADAIDPRSDDFFEMRLPGAPGWTNVAHARRPENRKTPVLPVLRVTRAGWHTLYLVKGAEPESHDAEPPVARRYPNWRVDRLVLFRDAVRIPDGDGPAETRNDGARPLPPGYVPAATITGPVYELRDGYLVIEAEDLQPHARWELRDAPAGFTGRGYLEWRGASRTRSVEGVGGTDDTWHTQQGPMEEWLTIRLRVPEDGNYTVDLRNHHVHADGDNDAWIGLLEAGYPRRPVKRVGDSSRDGPGFSWLDWGTPTLTLTRGEHVIYVGGRSRGFGVDRIAIYRTGDEDAKRQALDPTTPATPRR